MRLAEPVVGAGFGLRSPEGDDATFTVTLRSDPAVSRFLHRVPGDLESQHRWERDALARGDDLPFVVFRRTTGRPEGTAGIYGIDPVQRRAEWGRWALRRGSLAAVESVLLILRVAFDDLCLESLHCRTLRSNVRVLSFHDRMGFVRTLQGTIDVDGVHEDYVEHSVHRTQWPAMRTRLEPIAWRIAGKLT